MSGREGEQGPERAGWGTCISWWCVLALGRRAQQRTDLLPARRAYYRVSVNGRLEAGRGTCISWRCVLASGDAQQRTCSPPAGHTIGCRSTGGPSSRCATTRTAAGRRTRGPPTRSRRASGTCLCRPGGLVGWLDGWRLIGWVDVLANAVSRRSTANTASGTCELPAGPDAPPQPNNAAINTAGGTFLFPAGHTRTPLRVEIFKDCDSDVPKECDAIPDPVNVFTAPSGHIV